MVMGIRCADHVTPLPLPAVVGTDFDKQWPLGQYSLIAGWRRLQGFFFGSAIAPHTSICQYWNIRWTVGTQVLNGWKLIEESEKAGRKVTEHYVPIYVITNLTVYHERSFGLFHYHMWLSSTCWYSYMPLVQELVWEVKWLWSVWQ
jgi:hypothetical protein